MEFVMDEAKVGALSKRIMGIYEGALVSGMVYLGDEMGLYLSLIHISEPKRLRRI